MIAGAIIVAMALGIVVDARFANMPLARLETCAPTIDAVAFCAYELTAWMLLAQFRVRGYGQLAILGSAFAFTGVLQAAHFFFYPDMLGRVAYGDAAAQAAPWTRIVGRLLFAMVVFAYAVLDREERRSPDASRKYVNLAWIEGFFVTLVTILIGVLTPGILPKVFDSATGITPLYSRVLFPLMLASMMLAMLAVLVLGRRGSRLRIWLCVVLAANCGYLISVTLGETQFTSGFYVSRAYDLIGAFTFVFVVQTQLVSILQRSQRTGERAHALSQIIAVGDSQSYSGINAMLTRVAREFSFDYVALSRAHDGQFTIEFAYGSPGFPVGFSARVADSIARHAIDNREIYFVDDFTDTKWAKQRERTQNLWSSCCVLPIFLDDGLYGSVTFANAKQRKYALTALERDFLQLTSILVGNGIERVRQKKRLDELAYYDALTGLPNRVLLIDRITTSLAAAHRYGGKVAVHFLDLDSFKPINDRYGHAVGDDVLREVARRLERTVRASDTVGRYGGDEFVVLQPMTATRADVEELETRVADAFRAPIVVPAGAFDMNFSIGVSIYPDDGVDAHTLLIRADEAQYRVKDARKARRANPL